MKKTLILAGMLSIGYAHAQQNGKVGVNTDNPKSALDVRGGIRVQQGTPSNDQTNLGYAFGNDGDTGLFAVADPNNSNISTSLSLYTNNINRIFIKNDGGLVGINNTNPKVRLDVIGGGRFKRENASSTIEIDTDTNQWGHLDFRRNDIKRWDLGLSNAEETGNNAGSNFFISAFKDDGNFLYRAFTIARNTGNTGIGTDKPEAKLDVVGEIISRGQAQTDAYFGGDSFPATPERPMNDVEIGSLKAGITDISLYNRADGKTMNLFSNDVRAFGQLRSDSLGGDGDKIVVANNDGTLIKGVSVNNFATSNIYTADGTISSDRTVTLGDKSLKFEGNSDSKYVEVKNASFFPLVINATNTNGIGGGGIAVHPNDIEKRGEFSVNTAGDIRIYQNGNGDVITAKKETNRIGIGQTEPKAKLDVNGGIRALPGTPAGDASNLGYAFGNDGDTGLFAIADATNTNISTSLNLYVNNESRMHIKQNGDVNVTNLAGDGDKIVVANNDGTLVKGVSVSNFATSNLYTANGTLTSDRTVDQAGKWLNFNNGGVNITGNDGVYFPLTVNAMTQGGHGGINIQPNADNQKRIELDVTPEGNFRLWADGDKIYVNRSEGHVGIGNNAPTQRLDVLGNGKFSHPTQSTIVFMNSNDNMWAHLDFRRNDVKRWDAGMTDGQDYFINRFNDDGSYLGTPFFINRTTGNVGIDTNQPTEKFDVSGNIRSRNLAGDGDKIVIANEFGTLVKGVSVSNFATSNIYTADGSTNGDRTVDTANGFLTIKGNQWNPLVVNSTVVPSDATNYARGGLAVHPNDMEKRVEFATTADGDSRIWVNGDRMFIKRATGNVGIGNVDPSEKLDVAGSIKSRDLAGTGTRNVVADANGKLVIGTATTPLRTETASTTLTEADNGGYVYVDSASAATVTIPNTLPAGFSCIVVQQGAGQVTVNGVTIQSARGSKTRTQYSAIGVIKRTTDTATITGDAVN